MDCIQRELLEQIKGILGIDYVGSLQDNKAINEFISKWQPELYKAYDEIFEDTDLD